MPKELLKGVYETEWWYTRYWRATLAWAYVLICLFDFIIGPIFYVWYSIYTHSDVFGKWEPLTLSNAGVFHISMGAILGVSSWSRGQEKIKQMDVLTIKELDK